MYIINEKTRDFSFALLKPNEYAGDEDEGIIIIFFFFLIQKSSAYHDDDDDDTYFSNYTDRIMKQTTSWGRGTNNHPDKLLVGKDWDEAFWLLFPTFYSLHLFSWRREVSNNNNKRDDGDDDHEKNISAGKIA